jgi:cysteine dioxygenase
MSVIVSSFDCCEGLTQSLPSASLGTAEIRSISALVDSLNKIFIYFSGKDQWSLRKHAIECILSRVSLEPSEVDKLAFFDSRFPYTRNLIYGDGIHYSLLFLCWNENMESKIHNHPCDGCFVKSIKGIVREVRYEIQPGQSQMEVTSDVVLGNGLVTFMDDFIGYHKVGNAGNLPAITMHLYTPPYASCQVIT